MVKIFKEMTMKITKNMSQLVKSKEETNLGFQKAACRKSSLSFKTLEARSVSNRPRCVCSWKLLLRTLRKLLRTAKSLPKKTVRQVMDEWDLSSLVPVDTTKWFFRELEFKWWMAVQKPALTKKHLKARCINYRMQMLAIRSYLAL